MATYIRTEAGTAAVTNPRVFLPHRMRALLAAIDGRTDPRDYASGAWPAPEVQTMLDSLVRVGYVALGSGATAAPAVGPRPAAGAQPAAALPARASGDTLRDALALITDFTMAHLPQEALTLLFPLEGAASPDALRAQLGEYEARVARLGATGRRHLAELQALLAGASLPQPTP